MKKISMVIPLRTVNQELEDMTLSCIASYLEQVDEMIVVEDGGIFSPKILNVVDHYLYSKENVGFTKTVNRGWKYASGDYVMIVNSDTTLLSGSLDDLCIPGKVTSPRIVNEIVPFLAGAFFTVPATIAHSRGFLNENMRMYNSDSEYDHRIRDIFVSVDSVHVHHEMHKTTKAAKINQEIEREVDLRAYEKYKI